MNGIVLSCVILYMINVNDLKEHEAKNLFKSLASSKNEVLDVLCKIEDRSLEEILASAKKWSTAKSFDESIQFMKDTQILLNKYNSLKSLLNLIN